MCGNCGTNVGPFYLVQPTVRVCGPVKIDKETGKLIGRVLECRDRRRKLENEWYGKPSDELEEAIIRS